MRRSPGHLAVAVLVAIVAAGCGPTARPTLPPASEATPGAEPTDATPPTGSPADRPAPGSTAWEPGPDAPQALTEVAAAAFEGRLWVAGGLDGAGRAVDTVQVFDPATDGWVLGSSLPEPLHHGALVADADGLLFVGGYLGSSFSEPSPATYRLSPDGEGWTEGPALPSPRAAGGVAWDGTSVVYGGGVGPGGLSADVFVLDGDAWRMLGRLDRPREHLAAAGDGAGRAWLLGGRTRGLDSNLAAVDLVEGDTISDLGDLPTARGGVAAFWSAETGACLVGGEGPEGTFDDVECVLPDGTYRTLPSLAASRHGLGAAVVDGVAHVVAGGPQPGLTVSGVLERLVLASDPR